jgi:hypothetical protein
MHSANIEKGFQGFICNVGCQSAIGTSPRPIDQSRPLFLIGGGYKQPRFSQILTIEPHARSQRPIADSHYYDHYHLLHGTRDGSFGVSAFLRCTIHRVCGWKASKGVHHEEFSVAVDTKGHSRFGEVLLQEWYSAEAYYGSGQFSEKHHATGHS